MKPSRRELAQSLIAAGAATLAVQDVSAQQAPVTDDAAMVAARRVAQSRASALDQVDLPMDTQPAVHFSPRT